MINQSSVVAEARSRNPVLGQAAASTKANLFGDGIHFVQEDHGAEIGAAIVEWHGAMFADAPSVELEADFDQPVEE